MGCSDYECRNRGCYLGAVINLPVPFTNRPPPAGVDLGQESRLETLSVPLEYHGSAVYIWFSDKPYRSKCHDGTWAHMIHYTRETQTGKDATRFGKTPQRAHTGDSNREDATKFGRESGCNKSMLNTARAQQGTAKLDRNPPGQSTSPPIPKIREAQRARI